MKKIFFLLALHSAAYAHVVVHFNGRLGNQLFQAAAAFALAQENQCGVYFPDFERLDTPGDDYGLKQLKHNYAYIFSRIPSTQMKITPTTRYQEPDFSYHQIPYQPDIEISGYFLSEKYFSNYREQIMDLFSPVEEVERHLESHFSSILQHEKSVGIHVRTGYLEAMLNDFNPKFYERYLPPDIDFFKQAMELFDKDSLFVVFSDHINWCKEQFAEIDREIIFVENQDYIYDFYLLSKCKHTILANSSFGWWAAYLNKNPDKKVVCRMPFWTCDPSGLKDIICSDWTTITMRENPPIPKFTGPP